ncbi:MAG: ATP-binding protein [Clostridia bacterium]|nr:ATP-binding protein [Clostridia bacterium]
MKYGLIGEKLGHSFSKPIHEKIAGYTYEIKEIAREDLDAFMKAKDFCGINVTIPYKADVIPYLDYIDPTAEKIGAVNTVVNREGKLYGYNTDFGGMKALIERCGFDYTDKKVLVLGTGGTSKTANAVAAALGAGEIITVGREQDPGYQGVNYENVYSLHRDADYIINATPLGMYPNVEGYAVEPSEFPQLKGLTDVVYNPLKTRLCQKAEECSVKNAAGLYMLVGQAVLACSIFTGKDFDTVKVTDEIFGEIVSEKQNIVLIGMPGSGKSTIGKALSEKTGKPFIDTDEMIVEKHGVISDIFAQHGEEYFRDRETEAVKEAAKQSGMIIATGGGAILRKENVDALKQNGVIFFLNRPLEDIIPTDDRPLSSNIEALKKRFDERYDKYVLAGDCEIHVDGIVENAVNKILECLK